MSGLAVTVLHAPAKVLKRIGRRGFGIYNAWTGKFLRARSVLGLKLRNKFLGNKPITLQAGGFSYAVLPEGSVALQMWSGRHFDKRELELVLELLRPGMTFIDVGANVGLFSLPASKKISPGKVYAFEPAAWTINLLVENGRLNGAKNLEVLHSAVGDQCGEAVLQVNVPGKDGLNTIGRPTHEDSELVGTERVPLTTLDTFISERGLAHVDVMKVDVEGAELLVFRGASKLLADEHGPIIVYESGFLTKGFGYHPVETLWLLEKFSYEFFVIDPKSGNISVLSPGGAYGRMVIAVKPTHPQYERIKGQAV